MQHVAINPKHQRALDRLYKADRKYCVMVDAGQEKLDSMDPDSDRWHDAAERIEQKNAEAYDAFFEAAVEQAGLPKRELEAFAKSYEAFHGYTPYLV